MSDAEIIIIGAGIAGASLGWQLAADHRVLMLEQEDSPAHHSTGRSAAMQTVYAGAPVIQAASLASRGFFANPPEGFTETPIVSRRGVLRLTDAQGHAALEAVYDAARDAGRAVDWMTRQGMLALDYPLTDRVVAGLLDREPCDIDVDALHQGFLRGAARQGAELRLNHAVTAMTRSGGLWRLEAGGQTLTAPVVVNAAGGFSNAVAKMANAQTVDVVPKKRTIIVVPTPDGMQVANWPMMADAQFSFYLKPERTGLLISPSDAQPQAAGDAFADELDVALAVDRMQHWLKIPVRRVSHSWAGLRSFAADEDPLVGFDTQTESFFWYAGQGGFGVQSAPALSRAAAHVLRGCPIPDDLQAMGLTQSALSQNRPELCNT